MSQPESDYSKSANRRGRPGKPAHKKKQPRNLSISDKAWDGLKGVVDDLDVGTPSELLERIGLNQLQVLPSYGAETSQLQEIHIYQRLKTFIQPPVAVFWSILGFVRRVSRQIGLDDDEELICEAVKKSMAVVFCINYTHPDVYINNPSALLRWASYRILVSRARDNGSTIFSEKQSEAIAPEVEHRVKECLHIIGFAIRRLKSASTVPHYQVLRMKAIDGLTINQIVRIFQLQSYKKDHVQVGRMIKKGLACFRDLWETPNEDQDDGIELEDLDECIEAEEYCQLAALPALSSEDELQKLEQLLLKTSNKPYLDFWMNEIDHHFSCEGLNERQLDISRREKIRARLDKEIDSYLSDRKEALDKLISFCSSEDEMKIFLRRVVSREIGENIPPQILLGVELDSYQKLKGELESLSKSDVKQERQSAESWTALMVRLFTPFKSATATDQSKMLNQFDKE